MSYDPAKASQILELMAEEGLGLIGACRKVGLGRKIARTWAATIPEFARDLAEARRQSYEHWSEEIISIAAAAAAPGKTMAEVTAARLEVDSRKWLLSKLNPQQYGDRVELTGAGGEALFPASPEAAIPRLLQVLAVLLPGTSNSELFTLASTMASKLRGLEAPKANGEDRED